MKKFTDIEYKIYENIAQAKSILRKNGGSIEDNEFLQIADTTNKDGWTGLLTRLVYKDGIGVGEVTGIYTDLKKSKLDLGKLNKMGYDDIINMLYIDSNEDNNGVEFVARTENYLIFHVKTFEDGLKICSPAWCLKTRSHWDDYTNNGFQFVVIHENYVSKSGKTKLLTPNSPTYFGSYTNEVKPEIRYGISVKSYTNIKVFNDTNRTLSIHNVPENILNEINTYLKNLNNNPFPYIDITDEYDYIKELFIDYIDSDRCIYNASWDNSIRPNGVDYNSVFDDFMEFMEHHTNMDLYEFYTKHRVQLIDDESLTICNGVMDFILYRLSGNKSHDDGGLPLSGMFLSEREIEANSYKYIYGFSLNKYGKMYILQSYENISTWYNEILTNFCKIFLIEDMSHSAEFAYDNSKVFTWMSDWIESENTYFESLISIFFNDFVDMREGFATRIFFINEFIETLTNWVKIKDKLILNDGGDTIFAEKVFSDNSINNNLLIEEMMSMSKYTSKLRIEKFINSLTPETIFIEYASKSIMSQLNREEVLKFFYHSLGFNEYDDINSTSDTNMTTEIELIPNNSKQEKSDGCMIISFHYNSIK